MITIQNKGKWHSFCISIVVVNIEEINRKHYIDQEMLYRVSYGLASKLLSFENGVIFLELEVRNKWEKSLNAAAYEIAQCWKNKHKELGGAVACKIFVINSKKYSYKRTLLHLGVHPGYDCKKGMIFSTSPTAK